MRNHSKDSYLCVLSFQLGSLDDVNALEGRLLNAMVKLTLRLSEKSFRPVMFRLAEWTEKALRMDSDMTVRNRAITGFALCNRQTYLSIYLFWCVELEFVLGHQLL